MTAALLGLFILHADAQRIKFGISVEYGAIGQRTEFNQTELAHFYCAHGIEANLFPGKMLHKKGIRKAELMKLLQEFHVINIRPTGEGLRNIDEDLQKAAEITSEALQEYVKSGGGLIVQIRPSRYANAKSERYWNMVFAPLGITVENNYGLTALQTVRAEQKPGSNNEFFYTDNIQKHEITNGVSGLWLPVNSFDKFPACPLTKYSAEYTFPVLTCKDGGIYFCDEKFRGDFVAGKTPVLLEKEAVPIIAVRQFGKGFVISIGVDMIYTGQNFRNQIWSNITEEKGLDGKPSDMMRLMQNSVQFAAVPALKNPKLGTFVSPHRDPIQFPEAVYWDKRKFTTRPGSLVYGIIGAHSVYSDGKNTVEEYVKSAKEAGLQFIVFADPISKLTPEKLEQLKSDCRAFSDDSFYACPGMEFTDGSDLKRFVFGDKIEHPGSRKYRMKSGVEYPIFDGEKVPFAGFFIMGTCAFAQNGFLNSGDFLRCKVHPESLWWFWTSIPYVFEQGRLLADNTNFGRQMLHDLRMLVPVTFDRIFSAEEVQKSKMTAVTGGYSLPLVKKCLNATNGYWYAEKSNIFCSYGNGGALKVNSFRCINQQEDPRRLHTRGTQRIRACFNVESPEGIREVRVMDRNQKPLRVFGGKGAKILEKEFELVHDKQHYIFLEAEDMKGSRLISHFIRVYDYKQSLIRCNDNLNILGALGLCWHPNWPEKINLFKDFRNAELLSVQGWDRAGSDCPRPKIVPQNTLYTENAGKIYRFAKQSTDGVVMDVKLAGGDLQIVESKMDDVVQRFGNPDIGHPWAVSPPKILSENEYFSHHQKVYYLRDRQDFHIAWDHGRLRESLKEYDGSLCLVSGEITFKKNFTFSKKKPVPFVIGRTVVEPLNVGLQDSTLIVKDAEAGLKVQQVSKTKKFSFSGRIAAKGFAATAWSKVGTAVIFPISDSAWRYHFLNSTTMDFGVGIPGTQIRAGEKIRYAFVSADVVSNAADPQKYEKLSRLIRGEYPNRIAVGKKISEPLFFHVEADENEAVFEVGPAKGLGIDLPIKISNLQDNGCVAIYSTKRPWFRFIGIADGENTAYTQEPMDEKNRIWIGNVFTADNPCLKLTLVADGQSPDAKPFLEIHNPSGQMIKAVISSPRGTPVFGGTTFPVTVSAKDSVKMTIPRGR